MRGGMDGRTDGQTDRQTDRCFRGLLESKLHMLSSSADRWWEERRRIQPLRLEAIVLQRKVEELHEGSSSSQEDDCPFACKSSSIHGTSSRKSKDWKQIMLENVSVAMQDVRGRGCRLHGRSWAMKANWQKCLMIVHAGRMSSVLSIGLMERGVPQSGLPQKMRSWTCVRRRVVFRARAQCVLLDCRNKAC